MKALIVYDSVYGNTQKIAMAIAEAVSPQGEVKVLRASEADLSELSSAGLLILDCPTHGGRPTPAMQEFLNRIPAPSIQCISVATFDTRASVRWVKIFGYAAGRIADSLKRKGATLVAPPAAFFAAGKEGPLKEGELERAADWAKGLPESKKQFCNAPHLHNRTLQSRLVNGFVRIGMRPARAA